MTDEVTFVAFSNEELESAPPVQETSPCPECGKPVKVEMSVPVPPSEGTEGMLQFIKCCGKSFLVGIDGKDITNAAT